MRLRTHSASFHPPDVRRPRRDLFFLGALILLLAQVSLRWFPAQVASLDRVPDVILLACLLGTAIGCLAAGRAPRLVTGTPLGLALALLLATDKAAEWANRYNVPIGEIFPGLFFVLTALTLAGLGQELGRALERMPSRLLGFTLTVLGSAAGLVLFAACTYAELGPCWWFLAVVLGLTYFVVRRGSAGVRFGYWTRPANLMLLAGSLGLIVWTSSPLGLPSASATVSIWSPYGHLEYNPRRAWINFNGAGSQGIMAVDSRQGDAYFYTLPFLLNRDTGGPPFRSVLVIGAGTGSEVSRALRWGAERVDAIEVDPVILRLGRQDHPDRPYQDPRVHVHLGDGRRFLRSCERHYDLILFDVTDVALPLPAISQSNLLLHSGTDAALPEARYEDCRRESYLLTRQAFADVRQCLSPNGVFVLNTWIREGWFCARLRQGLEEVFPESPLILPSPSQNTITPGATDSLVLFFAGNILPLRQAFQENPIYRLDQNRPPDANTLNGLMLALRNRPPSRMSFGLATVAATEYLDSPEDDWPFLFLRRRMIPDRVKRDLVLLAILSVVLLWAFRPSASFSPFRKEPPASLTRRAGVWPLFRLEMFCLGTGLMLTAILTRVDATLFFGDTWIIAPVTGLTVLILLLAAVGVVLVLRTARLWPLYAGLLAALFLHRLFPLDHFLSHGQGLRAAASYLLGLAPVLFAGMIVALLFRRSPEPAQDVGAVLAGAVLGGMMGTLALVWGYHSLVLPAVGSFAVAAVPSARRAVWEYERRYPFANAAARYGATMRRMSHFGKR